VTCTTYPNFGMMLGQVMGFAGRQSQVYAPPFCCPGRAGAFFFSAESLYRCRYGNCSHVAPVNVPNKVTPDVPHQAGSMTIAVPPNEPV